MQFLKSRNFNAYFNDTFRFFKEEGKHFFKNFITINGIYLLLSALFFYIFFKYYLDLINAGINEQNPNFFENFMSENSAAIAIFFIVFSVIIFLGSIIFYSTSPAYVVLYLKNDGTHFGSKELFQQIRAKLGKILIFYLITFLLFVPLMIVLIPVLIISIITIVGPLIVLSALMLLISFAFMEFVFEGKAYFQAFGVAKDMLFGKKRFWPAVGSSGILYFIVQIVQSGVMMIFYIIGIFFMLQNVNSGQEMGNGGIMSRLSIMGIGYGISLIVSFLCITVIQINQLIIYYSIKEDMENISTAGQIELIGENMNTL